MRTPSSRRLSLATGSLVLILGTAFLGACGKDKKKNDDGGGGGPQGNSGPQQPGVVQAGTVSVDFGSAVGLLVVDSQTPAGGGAALTGEGGGGGEDSLKKIKDDGELGSIFNIKKPDQQNGGGPNNGLPKIKTIAVSPTKEIFLHFERPFIYRSQTEPQYMPKPGCEQQPNGGGGGGNPECHQQGGEENPNWHDPWDMASGFQCQIFKVKGGTIDQLTSAGTPSADETNLECLDNQHFVNDWQTTRNSVFQFDRDGNVYYPGSTPNSSGGRMVVYKRTNDGTVNEVINANICVQDFLVTMNGGVFYTGSSSCGGGGGSSGGFFRYVSPEGGQLREIARDWWNFVFEAVAGASGDQAVFFGPDPRSATTASWNSACLFRYDPSNGNTAQLTISDAITCGADIQSWLDLRRDEDRTAFGLGFDEPNRTPKAEWKVEFKNRCESAGQVFAGGGSQINAIKQDANGKIYVIGQVRKKKAGAVSCNVQIKGAHCADKDGIPHLPTETGWATKAACTTAGGTWTTGSDGRCEVDFSDQDNVALYTAQSVDACLSTRLDDQAVIDVKPTGGSVAETVRWVYQRQTDYNNVASPICTSTGAVSNIWDWNVTAESHHIISGQTVADTDITHGAIKYSSDWWRCVPKKDDTTTASTSNGPDQWLTEYKGLAEVDATTKTLVLRSSVDEQAINLWLIDSVPYYSAYNTSQGRYFLKRYNSTSNAQETVAEDFETYNLSPASNPDFVYYDGLNFSTNEYSFGTIDKRSFEFTRKAGLSGQVKMIVVLPKN